MRTSPNWGERFDRPVVVQTKLSPRQPAAATVRRAHLIGRVLESRASVVLVRAPAGYGKTTLASQCFAAAQPFSSWLSLDASDDDPLVLVSELAASVGQEWTTDWRLLLNGLAGAHPRLLVLDNADLIQDPAATNVLIQLCAHLPAGWKVLLSTRHTPCLPVARLRAQAALLELGASDLRLSPSEARRMLANRSASLSNRSFEETYQRAEGWAAGLCLNTERGTLREYFADEALSNMLPDLVHFLMRTSILDRLCGPLCDAVLERSDSTRILARLNEASCFVAPVDAQHGWYRYHHMFADALQDILLEAEPERVRGLHARASAWYEAHDAPIDAAEHALHATLRRRAIDVFARCVGEQSNAGELNRLHALVQEFSDVELAQHAPAAAGAAWVLGQFGERARTRRCLTFADKSECTERFPFGERSSRSATALLRAAFGWEGVAQMRAMAETAYRREPSGTEAHERSALVLGASLMLSGRSEVARVRLQEAAAAGSDDPPTSVLALGLLGLLSLECQLLADAEAAFSEGMRLVEQHRLQDCVSSSPMYALSGALALARGKPQSARAALERAVFLTPMAHAIPWLGILVGNWVSRLALDLGDRDRAGDLLTVVTQALARYPDSGVLATWTQRQTMALQAVTGGGDVLQEPLTEAELRVLDLAPTHLTLEQIGRNLCISRNTVKTHLKTIYAKLSVSSRGAAVHRANEIGLFGRHVSRARLDRA